MRSRRTALGTALVLGALLPMSTTALASSPELSVTTVATGLDNPRGLTVGPDGTVYVAEAGTGAGSGDSGAVTAITDGVQERSSPACRPACSWPR